LYFNVATSVAFTNTLLGVSLVNAGAGTATANVEFNSSTGGNACVEAKVVGGTVQSTGNPVMMLDNTGTVNLNMSLQLASTVPACMTLYGNQTYTATCATGTNTITAAQWRVKSDMTPADSAQAVYLWTSFSGCTAADTTTRVATVVGNNTG
jgi:hypothetical protein